MESSEGFSRRKEKCAVHFSGDTDNDALVCTRQDQVEIIEERARQWICLEPPKLPEKAITDNFLQNILLSSSLPPSATTSSTSSSSVVATARSSSRPASASIASVPSSRVDDGVSHTQAVKVPVTGVQHHRKCYTRFTSMYKFNRAKSQKRKVGKMRWRHNMKHCMICIVMLLVIILVVWPNLVGIGVMFVHKWCMVIKAVRFMQWWHMCLPTSWLPAVRKPCLYVCVRGCIY